MNNTKKLLFRGIAHSKRSFLPYLVVGGLFTGQAANAAIMWDFNYIDPGQNIGFFDPVNGQARRDALEAAAAQYGALFTQMATVTLDATSSENAADPTLASAASNSIDPGAGGFNLGEVVRTKVLTGNDLNGVQADGVVDVNWGQPWETSANTADIDNTEFDFFSTIFHELNHALGFAHSFDANGNPLFGNSNDGTGSWSTYDGFLVDVNLAPIIDPTTFILDQALWDAERIGGASPAGGIFFNGPNAVAANGGNPVGLFTPAMFSDGSSVSHLDDDNPALMGLLMLAATDTGPSARTLSDIEKGFYMDLGYSFATQQVPEPPMILLLGISGLMAAFFWRTRRPAFRID